jgi:hypothetical protein
MSSAQFTAQTIQLSFNLGFAQCENSVDNASHSARTGRDKRSIDDAAGTRPEVDSRRDKVQCFDIFWVSLKSSASA